MREFAAKVKRFSGSGTWFYADVPFDVVAECGSKGQVCVSGTANGAPFSSTLMPHGNGTHFLILNKAIRDAAKVGLGGQINLALQLRTGKAAVGVPDDLVRALGDSRAGKEFFESLAPSYKKEYVVWLESAKQPATRERRIRATLELLEAGEHLK